LPNWPRRPFGNERDGSVNPAEATAVREAAERIIRGSSLAEVCRAWDAAGLLTATLAHWTPATLGDMLRSPRVAGLMPDGATVGQWSPVLPVGTWHAMCAALTARNPAKGHGAPGRLAWLLSGIATCQPCGASVAIRWVGGLAAGRPYYTCRNGHVSIPAREADAHIRAGIVEAHTRRRALLTDAAPTVDTAPMIEAVRRLDAKIAETRAAYLADAIELADMTAVTAKLRGDRDAAQSTLDSAEIATARSRSAEALAAEWDSLDLAQRRAVLTGLNLRITIARGFGWTVAERISVTDADATDAGEDAPDA